MKGKQANGAMHQNAVLNSAPFRGLIVFLPAQIKQHSDDEITGTDI